jgi:hypothetical protein
VLYGEINLGDVIWSTIMIFFFIIFLWMIFGVIGDIFRSHDLSGVAKTLWCLFIVFLPFLAVFIYLVARGSGMAERNVKAQTEAKAQFDAYVRETAGTGDGVSGQIKSAKELLDAGAITNEEFERIKASALAKAA